MAEEEHRTGHSEKKKPAKNWDSDCVAVNITSCWLLALRSTFWFWSACRHCSISNEDRLLQCFQDWIQSPEQIGKVGRRALDCWAFSLLAPPKIFNRFKFWSWTQTEVSLVPLINMAFVITLTDLWNSKQASLSYWYKWQCSLVAVYLPFGEGESLTNTGVLAFTKRPDCWLLGLHRLHPLLTAHFWHQNQLPPNPSIFFKAFIFQFIQLFMSCSKGMRNNCVEENIENWFWEKQWDGNPFWSTPLEQRELGRKEIGGHIARYPESVPTTPLW